MHPSSGNGNIGPNGGAVLHQQQPPPPPSSLSLAIANNYRAQYQHQQIPPFNSLPSKYGPVHPTNMPQHSLHPQSASPLPVQVFYGQPGQSGGGGGGSNGRPPKLNNQPYVIVSGGGGGGGGNGAHPNHRQHPQHPQSHPGQQQQQQLLFEQGNENQHHNLLTSPEVIKPINPFDDM